MFFFSKKHTGQRGNFNIKAMYFINTLAITIFVVGVLWKLITWLLKK